MPGQMVTFRSNGEQAEGYLASPPGAGKAPGVIVIQEWWGLVPHIKDVADRFAAAGYVALAPDLFHGKSTREPDEAGKLMMSLNMERAAKDLGGAFDYLKNHDACTGKIGSVGYCMGGGLSLYLATLQPVDACVVYYGALVGAKPDLSRLRGPVLGHYAEHDDWASQDVARGLEKEIRANGQEATFHIYPGTGHAFFNDARPEAYNADASKQSWERTLEFYKRTLA